MQIADTIVTRWVGIFGWLVPAGDRDAGQISYITAGFVLEPCWMQVLNRGLHFDVEPH